MNKDKSCKTCLKGKPIDLNGDILCTINGIVGPDYSCKKYRPIPPNALNINPLTCAHCSYYKVSKEIAEEHLGVCRLFTERKYNGQLRRACSKIEIKSEHWEMGEKSNEVKRAVELEKLKPILEANTDSKRDMQKNAKKNKKLKPAFHGKGS